ncbi:DUF1566 domain-containing protein [bacterium]|nr:DUF1566 domain-containing protein [bacterium]
MKNYNLFIFLFIVITVISCPDNKLTQQGLCFEPPLASTVCSGNTINGVVGTANCTAQSSDVELISTMLRDVGVLQINMSTETSGGAVLAAGFREVPKISKDDEGDDGSSTIVKALRPVTPCGESQASIDDRIAHCLAQNPATATWDGQTKGTGAESVWKLVTFTVTSTKEVWQDTQTGLLWSDRIGNMNWCHGSGSSNATGVDVAFVEVDPHSLCDNGANQDQVNPISACVQFDGAVAVAAGEDYATDTYGEEKGGMGAVSSVSAPEVHWRLPTRSDYMRAENNGIRFVLPNFTSSHWTSSIDSADREEAWLYSGDKGDTFSNDRDESRSVRCVGR